MTLDLRAAFNLVCLTSPCPRWPPMGTPVGVPAVCTSRRAAQQRSSCSAASRGGAAVVQRTSRFEAARARLRRTRLQLCQGHARGIVHILQQSAATAASVHSRARVQRTVAVGLAQRRCAAHLRASPAPAPPPISMRVGYPLRPRDLDLCLLRVAADDFECRGHRESKLRGCSVLPETKHVLT